MEVRFSPSVHTIPPFHYAYEEMSPFIGDKNCRSMLPHYHTGEGEGYKSGKQALIPMFMKQSHMVVNITHFLSDKVLILNSGDQRIS